MSWCLCNAKIEEFLKADNNLVLATLLSQYHGYDYTTTREAWKEEVKIMKSILSSFIGEKGEKKKLTDSRRKVGKSIQMIYTFVNYI